MKKEELENKILPIILVLTLLGAIVSLLDNFIKTINFLNNYYYLTVTIIWIVSVVLIYRTEFHEKKTGKIKLKFIILIIFTLIYILSISFRFFEFKLKKTKPADHPNIELSYASFINLQSIEKENTNCLDLLEFYLDDERCSFTEIEEFKFGYGEKVRTFAFDNDVSRAFKMGECAGVYGNRPIDNVLPILKERLNKIGKSNLTAYIETPEDLSRIIKERGDIFEQVMFSNDELILLKEQSPDKYETIRIWLHDCIGIYQPVLTFVIKNNCSSAKMINKVIYDVSEVGQVLGGESGPLYSIITYNHEIKHKTGNQNFDLKPPIKVMGDDIISFSVRVITNDERPGLCWYLKIHLIDENKNRISTENFQLIMSK